MDFDDRQLTNLMTRATSGVESPTVTLVGASLTRGKQLRRRRTGVLIGSSVAICGLATATAVALVPGSSDRRDGPAAAGSPRTSPSTSAPSIVAPIAPELNQRQVLDTFARLLPGGATLTKRDGYTSPGSVGVTVTYRDHDGEVQMDTSVDYPRGGGGLGAACQISVCTTRPDGSTLAVYQGSDRPGHPAEQPQEWSIKLERRDGTTITVTEWNARTEKTASSVTRTHPPLSIAQVTAIVASPEWVRTR